MTVQDSIVKCFVYCFISAAVYSLEDSLWKSSLVSFQFIASVRSRFVAVSAAADDDGANQK